MAPSDSCIRKRLDSIAKAMTQPGADIKALSKEIDQLLGTHAADDEDDVVDSTQANDSEE